MSYSIKDKTDLETQLGQAGEKLVVINFTHTEYAPCQRIAPHVEELATEEASSVVVLKVNVEECEELAEDYNVIALPKFLFLKNGETLDNFARANYDMLKATVNKHK